MYEYISGSVAELTPAFVVIDAAGIGYQINISLNTYAQLENQPKAKIFTHLVVRDDAHLLYGFFSKEERDSFRHLITVSGVGASTARLILSSLSTEELTIAISQGDVNLLKQVKGIGLKTAQRIVVDLKDKIAKGSAEQDIFSLSSNTIQQESLSALVMLGFAKGAAEKIIMQIVKSNPNATVESIVKEALKKL